MKRLSLLLLLWVAPLFATPPTPATVTGKIVDTGGRVATSGYVEFRLYPSLRSMLYRISGTGLIAFQYVRCAIDPSGNVMSADDVTQPCEVWENSNITPSNSSYTLVLAPNGSPSATVNTIVVTGSTYDLSTPIFGPGTPDSILGYSITALRNLTTNGFVKTSGGIGTLNVETSIVNADIDAAAAIAWTKISKTSSSLADLATRSASDLSSGLLGATYGGSGLDTHTSTGIPQISAGTWSVNNTTGSNAVVLATSPMITTPTISSLSSAAGTSFSASATPSATSHAGWDATLQASAATTEGAGGSVNITAGAAATAGSTAHNGGNIVLTPGAKSGSGTVGVVEVTTLGAGVAHLDANGNLSSSVMAGADFGSQAQYNVYAAPSTGAGNPTFRLLVANDIPDISGTYATKANPTFTGLVTLPTGSTSMGPLQFVSGGPLTIPVAGTMEFAADSLYFTITTAAARKIVAWTDSNISGTAAGLSAGLANPSASVGLTAVNGSSTTPMRSDGAPALDVSITPTWIGLHTFRSASTDTYKDSIAIAPGHSNSGAAYAGTITNTKLTAAHNWTFPDAAITVNAAADISGMTLASGVTGSSLTSFGTSPTLVTPTFTTSATGPILYGGTAAGSTLSLVSTSGTGSGDAVYVKGGTNGGTTLATFQLSSTIPNITTAAESWIGPSSTTGLYFKSGKIGVGTTTPTNASFAISTNNYPQLELDSKNSNGATLVFSEGGTAVSRIGHINGTDGRLEFATTATGTDASVVNMVILPGGYVGIGTVRPTVELVVKSLASGDPRGIISWQQTNDVVGARLHLRKARDSTGTEAVVVANDYLGKIRFSGYDGAAYLQMGSIDVQAVGTIASNRIPTQMIFSTATDATTSLLLEAFRLNKDQTAKFAQTIATLANVPWDLGVLTTSTTCVLHATQYVVLTAGGIPVKLATCQ